MSNNVHDVQCEQCAQCRAEIMWAIMCAAQKFLITCWWSKRIWAILQLQRDQMEYIPTPNSFSTSRNLNFQNYKMYFYNVFVKLQNVFFQIAKCIFPRGFPNCFSISCNANCKMIVSKVQNMFFLISKCLCPNFMFLCQLQNIFVSIAVLQLQGNQMEYFAIVSCFLTINIGNLA